MSRPLLSLTLSLPFVGLVALGACRAGPALAASSEPAVPGAPIAQDDGAPRAAVAVLRPIGDSGVRGLVYFEERGGQVRIAGSIAGLSPGLHGFHVHEFGDVTDTESGESAGEHFAPEGHPHGRPEDEQRHVGDLGNVRADERGVAEFTLADDVLSLAGPHAVVGRALVVHEDEDTFAQPSGEAGGRLAFGVIGIAEPSPPRAADDETEPPARDDGGER